MDDAIEVCSRTAKISRQRHPILNLLQVYLFFKPDKEKAKKNYSLLMIPPRPRAFKSSRSKYEGIIQDMESILNVEFDSPEKYEHFLFLAIQYKAYTNVLPLLMKLDEKFPNNSKLKSRLGITLSSHAPIHREDGLVYLKEAIQLFKKENNSKQLQRHIIYYFTNLLHHDQMKLLEDELRIYEPDLINDHYYFRFLAHYSFANNQDFDEAIVNFEKAIIVADSLTDKRECVESLLRFFSKENSIVLYKEYFLKYEKLL